MTARKVKIALGAVALLCALKWWFTPPSEAQMKMRFVEQRADFEQLRVMFQHDAPPNGTLLTIHQDADDVLDGPALSATRVQEYHALFKKLGIISVIGDHNEFHMAVFGGGFTDTTWGVGYAYSRQQPKRVVPSAYSGFAKRDEWIFSPLKYNWYLYRRH